MITYELAKQLKDAGFPQENSEKYYCMSFEDIEGYGTDYVERIATKEDRDSGQVNSGGGNCAIPTLSELIEACVKMGRFAWLGLRGQSYDWDNDIILEDGEWEAIGYPISHDSNKTSFYAKTTEEAVANLWLELNNKI